MRIEVDSGGGGSLVIACGGVSSGILLDGG